MALKPIRQIFNAAFIEERHIAPLAVFRVAFGLVMFIGTIRFIAKGWVHDFYLVPKFFFTFWGFHWVKPLGGMGMYIVFGIMAVSALFIALGFLYRLSAITFFISFLYTELIDKTYYLNHYYFVSIVSFLLIMVPAQRYFSVDAAIRPSIRATSVPAWTITIFKLQLCMVYFFAGLAKLNDDWLIAAQPLATWLPSNADLPVIGGLLAQHWVAVFFSWFGAVYDLCIWYFLLRPGTRGVAYIFVVIFHVFTAWFFKIGMFPYIMICLTVVFFSENFHRNLIARTRRLFNTSTENTESHISWRLPYARAKAMYTLLSFYFLVQLVLPFRYLLYPGKLFWTEEGYRFSWRVMLMEKGGTAFFRVTDPATQRSEEVINSKYLTALQEKMMETQPDMILQFAHYLHDVYQKKGIAGPIIKVQSYVTLNGSGSRLFVDSTVDLARQREIFLPYTWLLPFKSNQ